MQRGLRCGHAPTFAGSLAAPAPANRLLSLIHIFVVEVDAIPARPAGRTDREQSRFAAAIAGQTDDEARWIGDLNGVERAIAFVVAAIGHANSDVALVLDTNVPFPEGQSAAGDPIDGQGFNTVQQIGGRQGGAGWVGIDALVAQLVDPDSTLVAGKGVVVLQANAI